MDDFLVLCRTKEEALEARDYVSAVLDMLGLQRNPSKGFWEPTQTLEHLGLGVDTVKGQFFVTPARLERLRETSRTLLGRAGRCEGMVPRRQLAAFAGLAQSLYLALPPARLFLRSIHDTISSAESWHAHVRLASSTRTDLSWFVDLPSRWNGRDIWRSPFTATLHCDASKLAWGGVLNMTRPARGFWKPHQQLEHITLLELRAVLYTCQSFRRDLRGKLVQLWEDNQAVVAILRSWTSKSPDIMRVLRKLWLFLDTNNTTLVARYIPTAENVQADGLSRQSDTGDWRLNPAVFSLLDKRWGPHHRPLRHHAERSAAAFQLGLGGSQRRGCRLVRAAELGLREQLLQSAVERAGPSGAAPARNGRFRDGGGAALAGTSLVSAAAGAVRRQLPLRAATGPVLSRAAGQLRARRACQLANNMLPRGGPPLTYWRRQTGVLPHTEAVLPPTSSQSSLPLLTSQQLQRAPAWALPHAERLRSRLGASAEALTAIRLSVTALASNTVVSYSGLWGQFVAFCASAGLPCSPASTDACLLYVAHLHNRGIVQPQSVRPYLSAINRYHKDVLGIEPGPASGPDIATLVRGWEQERADATGTFVPLDERVPLPAGVALAALQAAVHMPELTSPALCARFRALLFTGFGFALMARSDTDAALRLSDVGVDADAMWIRLRAEKGKRQNLRRRVLRIPRSAANGLLHAAVSRWLAGHRALRENSRGMPAAAAWAAQDNFWRLPDDAVWSSSSSVCTTWLSEATSFLGFSPPLGQKWTSHSLRKGAASAAHASGAPFTNVCFHGGWSAKSGAVHDYIDPTVSLAAAAAAFFSWLVPRISSSWATVPVP
jgi:hypothetical protein